MTILDKIVEVKRGIVKEQKRRISFRELERSSFFKRETYSLVKRLNGKDSTGIIAEFKESLLQKELSMIIRR